MDGDLNQEWCLIESDPGVFTELIRGFGAKGVQVEELYELNQEVFDRLKPVHGLIFLFKVVPGADYSDGTLLQDEKILSEIFFAKQVVKNACGTQALISILLNCNHTNLNIGETLAAYKESNRSADAYTRGIALANNETIRTVHNSFAPQDLALKDFYNRSKKSSFHFTSYFPFAGRLIEMDGRKEGPYDLGPLGENGDWQTLARSCISRRMQKYQDGGIGFSLLALVTDQLAHLKLADGQNLNSAGTAASLIELHWEQVKMEQYRVDNIRRRHQYLPLIVLILTALAEEGKLVERYQLAKHFAIRQAYSRKCPHDDSSEEGSSSSSSSMEDSSAGRNADEGEYSTGDME